MNTYRLSIRISADGFSLSIYNVLDGSLLQSIQQNAIQDTPLHTLLDETLRRPRLLDYTFQHVELLADTPSTCVPLEYLRREEVAALYRLNFPSTTATNAEIRYQILPSLEVVEIFCLDAAIYSTVQSLYPNVQLASYEGRLLEDTALTNRWAAADKANFHTHISDHSMLICSFLAGKLSYATTYRVNNNQDRLYYIMGAWKALGLDGNSDILHIHNSSSALVAELRRFIQQVETCE